MFLPKGIGTRHGRGTREKKNRLQSPLMFSRTFRLVKYNLINQLKSTSVSREKHKPRTAEFLSAFAAYVVGRILSAEVFPRCCPQKRHLRSLLPFLNRKTRRALIIAVDFVSVYSKRKKMTNFSTYPRRTYFNFPGRVVLRNGLWNSF